MNRQYRRSSWKHRASMLGGMGRWAVRRASIALGRRASSRASVPSWRPVMPPTEPEKCQFPLPSLQPDSVGLSIQTLPDGEEARDGNDRKGGCLENLCLGGSMFEPIEMRAA